MAVMEGTGLVWLAAMLGGYLALRLLAEPARYVGLVLLRAAGGYLVLWALNGAGLLLGYHLPLNPATAAVVGILGAPGLVAVLLLQRLYR